MSNPKNPEPAVGQVYEHPDGHFVRIDKVLANAVKMNNRVFFGDTDKDGYGFMADWRYLGTVDELRAWRFHYELLLTRVGALRKAQQAYMADRGNDALGKVVAHSAALVDECLALPFNAKRRAWAERGDLVRTDNSAVIEALQAENERLRAALKPLAEIAFDISKKDTTKVFQRMWTLADQAKQALAEQRQKGGTHES